MRRLLISFLAAPALLAAQTPAAIDSIVERAIQTFGNQGAAVAVVKDGKVIVANGFGIRKLGAPDTVGPDTRFGIASNSVKMRVKDPETDFSFDFHDLLLKPKRAR